MSINPPDDQWLDDDHTDELPVLLETIVLEPNDPRLPSADGPAQAPEHTARYPAFEAADSTEIEELRNDLADRSAKIEALEDDIEKLSARWADVERHLTNKDARIAELEGIVRGLREALAERSAAEQRLAGEIKERDSVCNRLLADLDRERLSTAQHAAEMSRLQTELQAARDEAAGLRQTMSAEAQVSRDERGDQAMREEIATLTAYIDSRRSWWADLEAKAANATTRIAELERELVDRAERQQKAEQLAQREVARATAARTELVEQARLVEALRRELAETRAANAEAPPRTNALQAELAAVRTAAEEAAVELAAARAAHAADRAEFALRDAEHRATRSALASDPDRSGSQPAEGAAAPSFEVIAQLEAEVEHKRQQVSAQLVELRERDERLSAAERQQASSRLELGAARTELEQLRADCARLERAVLDKDRSLEARDARIATLQEELSQRLGAVQQLNAMDLSLQGLDSKMSERLRRADAPPTDHTSTPALVCLTGDAPRQVALTKPAIVIGRGSQCDVQILTHFVSREHARITFNRGTAVIEDLGSTNGVFVNSVRVDRHELRQGDLITVGETQFRFLESMAH